MEKEDAPVGPVNEHDSLSDYDLNLLGILLGDDQELTGPRSPREIGLGTKRDTIDGNEILEGDETLAVIGIRLGDDQELRGLPQGNLRLNQVLRCITNRYGSEDGFPNADHALRALELLRNVDYCVYLEDGKKARLSAATWKDKKYEIFKMSDAADKRKLKDWFRQYLKSASGVPRKRQRSDPGTNDDDQTGGNSSTSTGLPSSVDLASIKTVSGLTGQEALEDSYRRLAIINERDHLKEKILRCRKMKDFKLMAYPDRRFEQAMRNLEKAQACDRTLDAAAALAYHDEWAVKWTIDLHYGSENEVYFAADLNQDRSIIKCFLLALTDNVEEGIITHQEVVGFKDQIRGLMSIILAMDRMQALLGLPDEQKKIGKHWYAREHIELMVEVTGDGSIRDERAPMNWRFLALARIGGIGLDDLRERYLRPTLSPLIECSERMRAVAQKRGVIIIGDISFDPVKYPQLAALLPTQIPPVAAYGGGACPSESHV